MTLYLASGNAGKLREFREGARPLGIEVEMLPGIQSVAPCVENGNSFEANAIKKSAYYSQVTGGLVFADDSGLCVDALGGAPGVYSARYAGEGATDEANNQRLLTGLARAGVWDAGAATSSARNVDPSGEEDESVSTRASAHYVCVIALAKMGKILKTVEGRAGGFIIRPPRGSGGFGYDPYFYDARLTRTFAELPAPEKFAVSHRGIAFRKMVDYLNETERNY